MPKFSDDVYDFNVEMAENNLDELVYRLEQDEEDEYYLSLGPRAYGPDPDDEGSDDCGGLFYWEK